MLGSKSILIVEDNIFLALDLSLAVEDLGGAVVGPVSSVVDALSLIASCKISGAVLDCELVDRDITPIVMTLIEQGVPLVLHTGTGIPPALAEIHPDLPVLAKPLKPAAVIKTLAERINDNQPPN
ncbi:MAG: response regulator [Sphingomicrobium sp.]